MLDETFKISEEQMKQDGENYASGKKIVKIESQPLKYENQMLTFDMISVDATEFGNKIGIGKIFNLPINSITFEVCAGDIAYASISFYLDSEDIVETIEKLNIEHYHTQGEGEHQKWHLITIKLPVKGLKLELSRPWIHGDWCTNPKYKKGIQIR